MHLTKSHAVEEKKRNNHLKHSAHANILWQEKCQTGYSQKKVLRIIFLQSRKKYIYLIFSA